jgi:hypothetical protein
MIGSKRHLRGAAAVLHHAGVEPEPLVHREELTSALFAISDLNANIKRIRDLLEEELGGEEGSEEELG